VIDRQRPSATRHRKTTYAPSPLSGNPLLAIVEVGRALQSSTIIAEMLATVAARVGETMSAWSCDIQTYIPERDLLVYEAYWCLGGLSDEDRSWIGRTIHLRDRPDLRAILESDSIIESHISDAELPAGRREQLEKWNHKATLDVPLRVGDRVVGILGVQETRFVRRYAPAERDLLRWLCELAAVGVQSATSLRRQEERSRHLTALLSASRAVGSAGGTREILDTISATAATALGAERSLVYLLDEAADTMTPRSIYQRDYDAGYDTVGTPEPIDDVISDRTLLTTTAPLLEHIDDPDLNEKIRAVLRQWNENSCLNAPITMHGRCLGVFMLTWTERERVVTDDEMALASGVAQVLSLALTEREAAP
jgi:GAF domain-containing protein